MGFSMKISAYLSLYLLLLISPLLSYSSDTKLKKELIYFDKQISNYSGTIYNAEKYLNYFDSAVVKLEKSYLGKLHESKLLREQLLFFLGGTYRDPYEYRILSVGFLELLKESRKNYDQLLEIYNQHVSTVEAFKEQLNALESIIPLSKQYPISTETIISIKNRFSEIITHLENHIDILKPVITEGKKYIDNLDQIYLKKIKANVLERLNYFFLTKSANYYNRYYFRNLYDHSESMLMTIFNNLKYKFPYSLEDIVFIIALLILLRGFVYSFCMMIARKYFLKKISKSNFKQIFKVFGWYLSGLVFAICDLYYIFPYDIIIYKLIVICYLKAVIETIICLNNYDNKVKSLTLPLNTFFYLFIYSIVFQELQIFPALLIIMWPAGILVTMYAVYKKYKIDRSHLGKKLLVFYLLFFAGLIVLNFLNYVYLSVFLFLLMFVFNIGLLFGASITKLIKKRFIKIPYLQKRRFLSIILKGIIIPLIWLAIIMFIFYWLSYQLLAPSLLFHFFTKSVTLWGSEIPIIDFVLLILLLFMVTSIKNMFYSTIEQFKQNGNLDKGVSESFNVLISYIFWLIYLIIILYFLNINIWGILIASGGLSIGIGFGLKDMANNFISGLILIISKNIQVGDIIRINDLYGTVAKVNIRNTVILSPIKHIHTIPNSTIVGNELLNYKQSIRNKVLVNVKYDSDVKIVRKILNETAENNEHTIWHVVRFSQIGDRSLSFALYIKIDCMDYFYEAKDQITEKIHQRFKEEGIEVCYQKFDVNMIHENESK